MPPKLSELEGVFENFISVLLPASGIVLFVMFVWGGFNLLNSKGDPAKVGAAQKTLTSAVVGLVLFLFSLYILQFLEDFLGIPGKLTDFKISI